MARAVVVLRSSLTISTEWCEQCRQDTYTDCVNSGTRYCCNELLCFIKNHTTDMPADVILSTCVDFYDKSEVDAAYDLLVKNYTGERAIPERGADSDTHPLLTTLISALTHADDGDLPKLVAADLHRIPTITTENIDVVSLVKDVNLLKNHLENLSKRTAQEVTDVKNDVKVLFCRTERQPTGTDHASNDDTHSENSNTTDSHSRSPSGTSTNRNTSHQTDDFISTQNDVTEPRPPREQPIRENKQGKSDTYADKAKSATRVIATGRSKSGLEASQYESTERLFISFLKPETTENQLQLYIRKHIGPEAMCQKLRHRYDDEFASFKVTVRKRFVDSLMNPGVWPEKTVIDYFKSPPRRGRGNLRSRDSRKSPAGIHDYRRYASDDYNDNKYRNYDYDEHYNEQTNDYENYHRSDRK